MACSKNGRQQVVWVAGLGGGKAREQGAMLLLNQSTSVQLQEGRRLVAGTALGNVK